MDEKKFILFDHIMPEALKFEIKDLSNLTRSEVAQWSVHLHEKSKDGQVDPVVADELARALAAAHLMNADLDELASRRPKPMVVAAKLTFQLLTAVVEFPVLTFKSGPRREPTSSAPKIGWTILAVVCDREDLERSAGDLEEWYPIYLRERGRVATNIWYWAQITRTVLNRAWPAIERGLKLAEFFGKFSSN